MPERALAVRAGLVMALVYTVPVMAWLVAQLWLIGTESIDPQPSLSQMMGALFLLQCCALAVSMPWLLRSPTAGNRLAGAAMLLLVPMPLYALGWLAGVAHPTGLFLMSLTLVGLAGLLYVSHASVINLVAPGSARGFLVIVLQVSMVVLCWNYYDAWLQVLGL